MAARLEVWMCRVERSRQTRRRHPSVLGKSPNNFGPCQHHSMTSFWRVSVQTSHSLTKSSDRSFDNVPEALDLWANFGTFIKQFSNQHLQPQLGGHPQSMQFVPPPPRPPVLSPADCLRAACLLQQKFDRQVRFTVLIPASVPKPIPPMLRLSYSGLFPGPSCSLCTSHLRASRAFKAFDLQEFVI